MMNKNWIRAIILGLLLVGAFFPWIDLISLKSLDSLVWFETMDEGDYLVIEQSHSLSKSHIANRLVLRQGQLRLIETHYEDQGGAGMPDLYRSGQSYAFDDGFLIKDDQVLSLPIIITNHQDYDWQLVFMDKKVQVDHQLLSLDLERVSLVEWIYMKIRW